MTDGGRAAVVDLAWRYADATNHRDLDGVVDCWADDGVWDAPVPFGITVSGRDAIAADLRTRWDDVEFWVFLVGAVQAAPPAGGGRGDWTSRVTFSELGRTKGRSDGISQIGIYHDVVAVDPAGTARYRRRTLHPVHVERRPLGGTVHAPFWTTGV